MKTKSKLLRILLVVAMLVVTVFAVSSCDKFLNSELFPEPNTGVCYHEYGEWVTVTEATCTQDGLKKRVCSKNSEHFEEEVLPKLAHNYSTELSFDATQHWYECACGDRKDAVKHGFTESYVSDDKAHWIECECGVKTGLADHQFDDQIVKVEPTCTQVGINVATCSTCSATVDIEVPKRDHSYSEEYSYDETTHWFECECGDKSGAASHEWDNGQIKTEPSEGVEGEKVFTCTTCEATYITSIPALDHVHELTFVERVEPECAAEGTVAHYYCSGCEKAFADEDAEVEIFNTAIPSAHTMDTFVYIVNSENPESHDKLYECCGAFVETLAHVGGSANCNTLAVCELCDASYGSTNGTVHAGNTYRYTVNAENAAKHDKIYTCCNYAEVEDHVGGNATCTDLAKCELCRTPYGETVASNHTIRKENAKAPSCVATGCEEYWYCRSCKATFSDELGQNAVDVADLVISAQGHDHQQTGRVEATCEQDGVIYKTCSRCDDAIEEPIASDGHDWAHSEENSTAASCNAVGYNYDICGTCGELLLVETLAKTACVETVTTVESTCSVAGSKTYSCSTCGGSRTETLPLASHVYENETVAVTCLTDGYTLHECKNCDYSYRSDIVKASGHDYETIEFVQLTCLVDGKTVVKCQNAGCGDEVTTTQLAEGHKYSPATCTADAVCSACSTVVESAFGHDFTGSAVADVAATCTEDGYRTFVCAREGCNETHTEVPDGYTKTGHKALNDVWTETVEQVAACAFETHRTATCEYCSETIDNVEPYINHVFKGTMTVAPTCMTAGTMTYTCECGRANYDDANYYPPVEEGKEADLHKWAPIASTLAGEGESVGYTHYCTTAGCTATKTVVDLSVGEVDAETIKNADKVQTGDAELAFDENAKGSLSGNVSLSANKLTVDELAANNSGILDDIDKEILDRIQNNPNGILSLEATVDGESFGGLDENGNGGFGGKVTVKIPYTLQEGDDPNEIVVWYFGSEGLVPMKAVYTEIDGAGYATFETEHFSYYTVTRMTPAERCNLYGHNWDGVDGAGKTYIATCLTDGYTLHTCLRCKTQKITDEVKALGHDFRITDETEVSCTANGVVTHACIRCSVSYQEVEKATGHNYVITDSQAATCAVAGWEIYECSACGDSYKKDLPKDAHTYSTNIEISKLSCTSHGYEKKVCDVCGFAVVSDYIEAPGHNMMSETIHPTCTTVGYTRNWCANCNETFANTDLVDVVDVHEWNISAPTCTEDKKCVNCNKLADDGKQLGHLVDDGVCQRCGEKLYEGCIHNLDSSYLELKKHVPSSCNSHGYDQYVCKVCKHKVKINNPELDKHSYKFFKDVEATCTTAGYTVEICKHCNVQNKVETDPALGHNFVGSSCERCGLSSDTFYLNMLETWANVDGFAITIKDLSVLVYESFFEGDEIVWELVGEISQIDIAELMLFVDADGNIGGAAYGEMKIFNGPVQDEWVTYGIKAVIDEGVCYVSIYGVFDGENVDGYSMTFDVDWIMSMALQSSVGLDSEMGELLSGWFIDEILPIIAAFRDANAEEIDTLVGNLVNLIFTAKSEDGKTVYYLDYEKIYELNDDLLNLTVEEIVDKYFGDGAYADLTDLIMEIASLKLSEIPDYLESIGIDPYELAEAINNLCHNLLGAPEEFDILAVISDEAYGSYTVGDLIYEMISSNSGSGSTPDDPQYGGGDSDKPNYGEDGDVGYDEYPNFDYTDKPGYGVVDPSNPDYGYGNIVVDPSNPSYGYGDFVVDPSNPSYGYGDTVVVTPVKPGMDGSSDSSFDATEDGEIADDVVEEEEFNFLEQLAAALEQLGGMKLYESMAGEDAEQIHGAVESIIGMLENSLSIEITTDSDGTILDYEIAVDALEIQTSEYTKTTISFIINILPGAKLDIDLSDIIDDIKTETRVPEIDSEESVGMEQLESWNKDGYEYNGKYYSANIMVAEIYYSKLTSTPVAVVSLRSCGDWREIEAIFFAEKMKVRVQMVSLYDKETGESIMFYANDYNPEERLLITVVGNTAVVTYPDGSVKEFDARSNPDYRDLFPESWWTVSYDTEADYGYFNHATGAFTKDSPHSFVLNEELSKTPGGCNESGYYYYECVYCGAVEKHYYNDQEHNYVLNPDKSNISDNCNEISTLYYECTSCGDHYTARYSKGHNYTMEFEFTGDDCLDGVRYYEACADCGYVTGNEHFTYSHNIETKVNFDGVNVSYVSACIACGMTEGEENVHFDVETDYELELVDDMSDYWTTVFKFVPTETGIYQFFTKNSSNKHSDPSGGILDSNFKPLIENDDFYYESGSGSYKGYNNFAMELELIAGETYYLVVSVNSGYDVNSFTMVLAIPEVEQIDLTGYGCACGGTMVISDYFADKAIGFELNCDAGFYKPCSTCGFYYYSESGTRMDEHCSEIEYLSYYFVNANEECAEYNIYTVYNGNTYHDTYWNHANEEILDDNGNRIGYVDKYYYPCRNCGIEVSSNVHESYLDEYGNTVLYRVVDYEWSAQLGERIITNSYEEEYERFETAEGWRYRQIKYKGYDYANGEVIYWYENSYIFDETLPCKYTCVFTDSRDSYDTSEGYRHNTQGIVVNESEEGEFNGIPVTITTETEAHACMYCGQITEKREVVRYLDSNGNCLVNENRYYFSKNIEQVSSVSRYEYGAYEYAPGKYQRYTLLELNSEYSEDGRLVGCDGWRYDRDPEHLCSYGLYRIHLSKSGDEVVEDFHGEMESHINMTAFYVLGEGSTTCEDGVDWVYGCRVCGYIQDRAENAANNHFFSKVYTYKDNAVYAATTCDVCGLVEGSNAKYFDIASEEAIKFERFDSNGVYFSFIPSTSGRYNIYSTGEYNEDPKVYLYDSNNSQIGYDDDAAIGWNFALPVDLEAGRTYYLRFERSGNTTIHLENALIAGVDLSDYGCGCGGTVKAYKNVTEYDTVVQTAINSNCHFEYNYEYNYFYCTNCGFAYADRFNSEYIDCEEYFVVSYLFGQNGQPEDTFTLVNLCSVKTGNVYHETRRDYTNTSVEGVDANGNPIIIITESYVNTCVNCEKTISKTVYTYHELNGYRVYYSYEEYRYSGALSDIYLLRFYEYEYMLATDASGEMLTLETLFFDRYYNENGELTSWSKRESTYTPTICDKFTVNTDHYGNRNETTNKNHNTNQKPLPDESGTSEDGRVVTEAYEYYCSKCGASIEKYVYVRTYDEHGNMTKSVVTHYVLYAKSADDYGYRVDYVETTENGVYEYATGKYVTYTLSIITERFDEDGNSTGTDGWRYEYLNGNFCEYQQVRVTNGEDQYVNGPYTSHKATNYEYRLADGSVTCLDGVDRYYVCYCCGYERSNGSNYTGSHRINNSVDGVIYDLSNYSDCGGYIIVYSCACGQKLDIVTNKIGCYGALGYKQDYYHTGWQLIDGAWRYYDRMETYGCSVTHDANGENICGFKYSVAYWRTATEDCREVYHYVYTFTSESGESFSISYDYLTTNTIHRWENVQKETVRYEENGFFVEESGWYDMCMNCSYLDEEYTRKNYYLTDAYTDYVKYDYEYKYYNSNRQVYNRYGREYSLFQYENSSRDFRETYYFSEYYTDGVMTSFNETVREYEYLVYNEAYYGLANCKTVERSGTDKDNITYIRISENENKYFDFDGKTSGFYIVKSVVSEGSAEDDITYCETHTFEYAIVYNVDRTRWQVVTVKERYEYLDESFRETVWDYSKCVYEYTVTVNNNGDITVDTYSHGWNDWYTSWYGYNKMPTCTDDGSGYRRCNWCYDCGEVLQYKLGHSYSYDSNTGDYKCVRCGLVNFTSYDGAVTYEDYTGRLGNGTHFVVRYYFNYDSISQYDLWISAVKDGELIDFLFVEPVIDGNYIYLAAEELAAALADVNSFMGTEYTLCDVNISLAFVPKTDSSNFDCAITLDSHLPVYNSQLTVDSYGNVTHVHTAVCALCDEDIDTSADTVYSYSGSYNLYNTNCVFVDYYCSKCGERYKTVETIEAVSGDDCVTNVKYRTVYYDYVDGVFTRTEKKAIEEISQHGELVFDEIVLVVDDYGKIHQGYVCSVCGKPAGPVITVVSDYELEYSLKADEPYTVLYKFTATEAGDYLFYSTENSRDTYGYLYDENMLVITSNDDGGGNANFRFSYYLEEGATYYFGSRYYSGNVDAGYYTVNLIKVS